MRGKISWLTSEVLPLGNERGDTWQFDTIDAVTDTESFLVQLNLLDGRLCLSMYRCCSFGE